MYVKHKPQPLKLPSFSLPHDTHTAHTRHTHGTHTHCDQKQNSLSTVFIILLDKHVSLLAKNSDHMGFRAELKESKFVAVIKSHMSFLQVGRGLFSFSSCVPILPPRLSFVSSSPFLHSFLPSFLLVSPYFSFFIMYLRTV